MICIKFINIAPVIYLLTVKCQSIITLLRTSKYDLLEVTESPAKQLRGFQRGFLDPGVSRTVNYVLQRRGLSVWDTVAQKWKMAPTNCS